MSARAVFVLAVGLLALMGALIVGLLASLVAGWFA